MNEDLKSWAIGVLKSWTIWVSGVMIAFPQWWPLVEPQIRDIISPEHYTKLVPIIGIVMVFLRLKTTQSLTDKGAPKEGGFANLQLLGFLACASLLTVTLTACQMGPKPEPPKGIDEQIEAASIFADKLSSGIVAATCTKFKKGACVEPGKPLMPVDSISIHGTIERAHMGIGQVYGISSGGVGECLGALRSQSACLAAVNVLLLEVDRMLIENRGGGQ